MFDVVVLGSANVDYVFRTPRLPGPGETVMGEDIAIHAGGKGANQAVAAAKMGARTAMIGAVGRDANGDWLLTGLEDAGVDVSRMARLETATGAAGIGVAHDGANQIIVSPGANGRIDANAIALPEGVLAVLTQHEVPSDAIDVFLESAHESGVRFRVLNPAPARSFTASEVRHANVIVPNESEAAELTSGADDPAAALLAMGFEHVIITLGSEGALYAWAGGRTAYAAPPVVAVDTTAAGDVFCGALTACLAEGMEMEQAIPMAIKAAALSVTRAGAQSSIPSRAEVNRFG